MSWNKQLITIFMICLSGDTFAAQTYMIVDTGQVRCCNNRTEIECPKAGRNFFGQDAQYVGNEPAYNDNGDATVTDLNTGSNRWSGQCQPMAVHGAGAQRSDPKSGDPSRFPRDRGPQGDVIRIYNFVRYVRGGKAELGTSG